MDARHELDQEIQRQLYEEEKIRNYQAEIDLIAERAYQDVVAIIPTTNIKLPQQVPYNSITYEEFLSNYITLSRQNNDLEFELWPLIKSVETITVMRQGWPVMATDYLDDLLAGTSLDNAAGWISLIFSLSDDKNLMEEYLGADHQDLSQLENKQQQALIKKEEDQKKYVLIRAIRQASKELLVEHFGEHDNTSSLVAQIINLAYPLGANDSLEESISLPPEINRLCEGYIPNNQREKYIGILAVVINKLLRNIDQ